MDFLTGGLKRYITKVIEEKLGQYIAHLDLEGVGIGGDIVLHDLEIKVDALQELLNIPLTFVFSRGFIKELRGPVRPYVLPHSDNYAVWICGRLK